jgi:hypothetical protein
VHRSFQPAVIHRLVVICVFTPIFT